jgi:hypothetical protein
MNHRVRRRATAIVCSSGSNSSVPPRNCTALFQTASVTIYDNIKRATITAVGGAEFEINKDGIFPVKVGPNGRRLSQDFLGIVGGSTNTLIGVWGTAGQAVQPPPQSKTNTVTTYKSTCSCTDSSCRQLRNCVKCNCDNRNCWNPYNCVPCPNPSKSCAT